MRCRICRVHRVELPPQWNRPPNNRVTNPPLVIRTRYCPRHFPAWYVHAAKGHITARSSFQAAGAGNRSCLLESTTCRTGTHQILPTKLRLASAMILGPGARSLPAMEVHAVRMVSGRAL